MKFETLESDFEKVLTQLDIPLVRKLPRFNSTDQKGDYLEFYHSDKTRKLAVKNGDVFRKLGILFSRGLGWYNSSTWDRFNIRFGMLLGFFLEIREAGIRGHKL